MGGHPNSWMVYNGLSVCNGESQNNMVNLRVLYPDFRTPPNMNKWISVSSSHQTWRFLAWGAWWSTIFWHSWRRRKKKMGSHPKNQPSGKCIDELDYVYIHVYYDCDYEYWDQVVLVLWCLVASWESLKIFPRLFTWMFIQLILSIGRVMSVHLWLKKSGLENCSVSLIVFFNIFRE